MDALLLLRLSVVQKVTFSSAKNLVSRPRKRPPDTRAWEPALLKTIRPMTTCPLPHTILNASTSVHLRTREKSLALVTPSPVGLAMEKEV
jgi:hypothetical protein